MKNLLITFIINMKNWLIAFFRKKNLLITFFRDKKNLLINLYNNWRKLFIKNIKKFKDLSFIFTNAVSMVLGIWLRPKIMALLSSYIDLDSEYGILLSYLVYFLAYLISFLIVFTISIGIISLTKEFKNKSIKKKEEKFGSDFLNMGFFILSIEDLEVYANKNGIYHKVPEDLWIEYRAAKESCSVKGFNAKITGKLLKIRVKKYNNFLDLYNRILNLLDK